MRDPRSPETPPERKISTPVAHTIGYVGTAFRASRKNAYLATPE